MSTEKIPFSGNPLNRASEKRTDSDWIESKRRDPSSLVLPIRRLEPFLLEPEKSGATELGLLRPEIADSFAGAEATCIFLGLDGDRAVFAVDVPEAADPANAGALAGLGYFRDARAAAQIVSSKHAAIIAQAKALIDWHQRHGFCPNCGTQTKIMDAGYRRLCGKCNAEHFPRVDPVVIMLATHGEACLVGRNKRFPGPMFSALAGFMEPGETIEEAVRRETREEAGIACGAVAYFASQPWPFPMSLMIGCYAQARSREIVIDRTELDDARWFERDEVALMLAGRNPEGFTAPLPHAIAHHILRAWVEKEIEFD